MTKVAPIGKSDEYDHLYKLVLIGDDHVGKSSFLNMFVNGIPRDKYTATIGVEFATKTMDVDGEKVKLQIWDTAGQERFRTITRSYYRGAHGFIVMFDLSNEKTFVSVRANWLRTINDLAAEEDTPVILVGNKLDKATNRTLDFAAAQEFASDVGCEYYELSSTDKETVSSVMTEMARMLVSHGKEVDAGYAGNGGVGSSPRAATVTALKRRMSLGGGHRDIARRQEGRRRCECCSQCVVS